uniref:Uncharacterized protein n=1 Tax=Anguilla anguilla TaxID=7936 RepID=A0A0E9SMU7_ANGAN
MRNLLLKKAYKCNSVWQVFLSIRYIKYTRRFTQAIRPTNVLGVGSAFPIYSI